MTYPYFSEGDLKYRSEIDGLRAVAVVPVILFHAGFEFFGGGFVGVDIFFVISGYLITTIILTEKEQGKFSIVNFYERRARRILPALFFVMLCCLPFAWILLIPQQFIDFAQSLIAVSAFSSNLLFWQESGYFGTASELKPLLHTWSLAVEEQYYVLFPLFIMLVWRFRKKTIFVLLLTIAFISFMVAEWGAYVRPSGTFYLLPTRAWELAIGALIAFYCYYKKQHVDLLISSRMISEIFGFLGISLICYSIFSFNNLTPFPSSFSLAPTIGTGLIILFATSETYVGKFLSSKIMVGIGLISYSTYLWHQPIFVFFRHENIVHLDTSLLIVLSLSSLLFGYISWKYVEAPFRNKKRFSRRFIFRFSAVGTLLFLGLGFAGYANNGFPQRFSLPESLVESFERSAQEGECFDGDNIHVRDDWYCGLGEGQSEPTFVVFGDSHALSLFDAFNVAAKKVGSYGVFTGASGCLPFLLLR